MFFGKELPKKLLSMVPNQNKTRWKFSKFLLRSNLYSFIDWNMGCQILDNESCMSLKT